MDARSDGWQGTGPRRGYIYRVEEGRSWREDALGVTLGGWSLKGHQMQRRERKPGTAVGWLSKPKERADASAV